MPGAHSACHVLLLHLGLWMTRRERTVNCCGREKTGSRRGNRQGGRGWDSLVLVELPACPLTTEKKEHEAWS